MRRMYHAFDGAKTTLCAGYLTEAANSHVLEGGGHTPAEVGRPHVLFCDASQQGGLEEGGTAGVGLRGGYGGRAEGRLGRSEGGHPGGQDGMRGRGEGEGRWGGARRGGRKGGLGEGVLQARRGVGVRGSGTTTWAGRTHGGAGGGAEAGRRAGEGQEAQEFFV